MNHINKMGKDGWEIAGAKAKGKTNKKTTKAKKNSMLNRFITDLPHDTAMSELFGNEGIAGNPEIGLTEYSKPAQKTQAKKKKKLRKLPMVVAYKTIEEAMQNKDDLVNFDQKVKQMKEKVPAGGLFLLKDIVADLNLSIVCVERVDLENAKIENFPLCKANKQVRTSLTQLYGKLLPNGYVPLLFKYCLNSMLDCVARDQPALGFQMCLQALGHSRLQLCLDQKDQEKIASDVFAYENVPKKCFAYVWAISQTGIKDPTAAVQVWLRVLLPALSVKSASPYSLNYIEAVLASKGGSKIEIKLTAEQLHMMYVWVYDSGITNKQQLSVRDRVQQIYPRFEEAMMKRDSTKQEYFEFYLNHTDKESAPVANKMVELAVHCLQTNNHSVNYWRDNYLKNLTKSRMIVDYFTEVPEELKVANKRQIFRETIRSFFNTNEDLMERSDAIASKSDFHKIRKFCEDCHEEEDSESDSSLSSLWMILFLLLALVAGVVSYDVYAVNKGVWKDSRTHQYLEEAGALQLVDHAYSKINQLVVAGTVWYEESLPVYLEKADKIFKPYTKALSEGFHYCVKEMRTFLSPYVQQMKPVFFEYVAAPFKVYSRVFVEFCLQLSDIILKLWQQVFAEAVQWASKAKELAVQMQGDDFDWVLFKQELIAAAIQVKQEVVLATVALYEHLLARITTLVELVTVKVQEISS